MKVTIEHSFFPYCDEVTELYFRIINTILFLAMRRNCVKAWDSWRKNSTWWVLHIRLRCTTPLGLPATSQRQKQIFEHRIMMVEFQWYLGQISSTGWNGITHFSLTSISFYNFSFGCATPFCRNWPFAQSELETTLWKVWFSLPFFLPVPFFRCGYHYPPRMGCLRFCPLLADTFLMQWPFSDWTVSCLLQSQFKPGMSRFAILHWLSDGCLAFVPTFGFTLFLIITGLLVSHFHNRFYRSNHHFPLQR